MKLRERLQAWRYNLVPDHLIGEILTKRWTDNAIPFLALIITVATFGSIIPGFFQLYSLQESTRQLGEFSLVVIGLTVVMLGGGIDLAVGSIFALSAFSAVATFFILEQPVWVALLASLATGLAFGAVNGYLIGFLRLRAFITTLVTFIIGRALYDILIVAHGSKIQMSFVSSDTWDFIGDGTFLGISVPIWSAIVLAVVTHVALTRSRPGWHVLAVGGSRRSAHNAGIQVRLTVFFTYVFSGLCSALAGFLIATRLSGAGPGTGGGLEILALTAAVVGGNSLGGGRGSVVKGLMGAIIVLVLTNGLIRLGYGTGTNQMVLGILLAVAVTIDIRWLKNRHKVLNEVYVAPVYLRMGEPQSAVPGSGTPYALNNKLSEAEHIGLGELEGPEDVILDRNDNLYCGTRHGEIIRFFAPDYTRSEVFAHIGGFPLGLAFDADGNLITCVGAMGLYAISPDGKVTRLSAETARSWTSVNDDARLRDPNDLDIAQDGKIYFTDSTKRYDAHDWALDSIENRGTGRLLVYDPADGSTKTLLDGYRYTNGVCMAHDNKSLFFSESWRCRIHRYWLEGPKAGTAECVIKDMPGYTDNINRASDGTYWMAWLGMRTPSFDLSLRHPSMRKRMTRRLPQDEWLFPNINTGGVVKFDENFNIVRTMADLSGVSHPMVTSMREHKGELFIGGILNNRIGRFRIEGADPTWDANTAYWGTRT
ncbi:ribose transport system permease protein [Rhodobium orientis]|uniref:ABC transporter permease n=1 Tax=Rhodobium orientis TaxID=34017 RepID=A0A327JXA2_9HYPH|nr:SMP-30/gluconolactonase/LRE family protein [Rhodobium orientis]MBB4301088.1 ribose transport system permease protein [Rhodobium orientis]MBK5949755.1 ABC transporter permease [Rhodobium orientis]RAI30133.1 ABC transporter permease [Rhodobium orientis]